MVLGVQVEGGVKPLAHDETFSNLSGDLLRSEGLQHDERHDTIETGPVAPDREQSLAHDVSEVTFADVVQVGECVARSHEK